MEWHSDVNQLTACCQAGGMYFNDFPCNIMWLIVPKPVFHCINNIPLYIYL